MLRHFFFVTATGLLWALTPSAQAGVSLRAGAMASPGSSGAASSTSQTANTATGATSQSVQTSLINQHAQASLTHSIQALQALQATQAAARSAALAGANNLGTNPLQPGQTLPDVPDGLGPGGLNPVGGATVSTSGAAIQVVNLGTTGTVLALGKGGQVTLPTGTPGNDTVAISGAGTINTVGGTVTASAGSLTTSTGGSLVTTNGGTISVSGSSSKLTYNAATTITSNVAATLTLPAGGGTVAIAANQAVTAPAGSSLALSGTGTGVVTIAGSGTVTLAGAGTLTLATPSAAGSAGTITSNSGTIGFTSGAATSLAAGSTINLTGSGAINFTSGTGGAIPVILSNTANYTTTGTLLATTGYQVPASWINVGALSQSSDPTSAKITDTITQDAQQALLYWSSFNIGKNTTLSFDQSAGGADVGQWVAINQITGDPSLAPSQILGSIQGPGQVYVINQNGIIFGGSSQVNLHTLVASSLPINSNLLSAGLLSGASTDDQFLFSQLTVNALSGISNPTPAFTPPAAPAGADGDVTVQTGAQLSSPTTAEHVGGRIALIGPVVDNEGTISTPDGQAILAASLQVGLEAHSQNDPTLRGLDVYVGKVSSITYDNGANFDANGIALGTATNGGVIDSDRADVTITGRQVDQNGAIDSSTSVVLNGRVDLLADYNATVVNSGGVLNLLPGASGGVVLGANSVTQILPELSSADTVVGTSLALPSLVNIQGQTIYLGTDAELLAPGATVPSSNPALDLVRATLGSGVTLNSGSWDQVGSLSYFVNNTGQVYLDTGATIDVSGSANVSASVDENIIAVQLRGTELADSPTQRNGALRGQTVYVDIRQSGVYNGQAWIGTPLADVSGYAGLIQHDVGELTANGGSVAINAGSSVVMQQGSEVNVSGGYINYQGGNVRTTQVITDGQILGIAQATPNLVYQGIYNGYTAVSPKFGLSQTFSNPLLSSSQYDPSYIQGGNGGSLDIIAPTVALDGQLYGNTVMGSYQRTSSSQINSNFATATFPGSNFVSTLLPILAVPQSSTFSLALTQNDPSSVFVPPTVSPDVTLETQAYIEQNPPTAVPGFTLDSSGNPLSLPAARQDEVILSQDLVGPDGFGNLSIDTSASGTLTLPSGVNLDLSPGGSVSFSAANIDLESSISAPGGSLSFTAYNVSPYSPSTASQVDFTRGNFLLASGVSLNTAGLIVDDRATSPTAGSLPEITAGGSVTIDSFNANLENGSSINTSGGVYVSPAASLTYGNGGAITIEAGTQAGNLGGNLTLGASYFTGQSLESYSGAMGGSLTLLAPLIQVGGTLATPAPSVNIGNTTTQTGDAYTQTAQTLLLSPDFFNLGGFANFTLTGIGAESAPNGMPDGSYLPAVLIAADTRIAPVVEGYLPTFSGTSISLTPMTTAQAAALLPSQRSPVSLTFSGDDVPANDLGGFSSKNRLRTDIIMGSGATIQTGPSSASSVTLKGDTVSVLGDIFAPGGKISIAGTSSPESHYLSSGAVTVDLGPESELSTQGQTLLTPNLYGFRTGSVLNGGTVSVSGDLAAEIGAVIDVSGWSDQLDVLPGYADILTHKLSAAAMVATTEESNGGSITLTGGEDLFNGATLLGLPGGSTSATTAPGLAVGKSTAQGGTLTVIGVTLPINTSATPEDPTLFVSQNDSAFLATGQPVIGSLLLDSTGNPLLDGGGFLGVNRFADGGFGSITLGGVVQFNGSVNLAATNSLTISTGFVYEADDAQGDPSVVTLTAPHIAVGGSFVSPATAQQEKNEGNIYSEGSEPFFAPPTPGDGTFNINASTLADVGNLSLQGIGTLNFNGGSGSSGFAPAAQAGDIRGDGTLDVAGTINLNAREIYPATETSFNIVAYDSAGETGTVNIYRPAGQSLPPPPLSAGGMLNIYASVINQAGALRAPIGTINLGWNGTGTAPFDLVTGTTVDPTQTLTLAAGSVTSVSAQGVVIPYGSINPSGDWIDPAGNDIAAGGSVGLPAKLINISALTVATDSGATIDISGGGDLYANEFVSGVGGTNNILASSTSFAVVPSYSSGYAYAPYDAISGYATSAYANLQVGDQIYLNASNGLPAGTYTLLPAGYSLLPGAFLVTPKSGTPGSTLVQTDGSSLVSGYRTSGLNGAAEQPLRGVFEVAPQDVVNARAEYDGSLANAYFPLSAQADNVAVPRLPVDAGQLVIVATESLSLPDTQDTLLSQPGAGGLGGEVDIASPIAINIYNDANPASFVAGDLNLDAASLDAFDADSLLIGGYRTSNSDGTSVTVLTNNLTVNNAGEALTGNDVILASNQTLMVDAGAEIDAGSEPASGSPPVAQNLSLTGDGAVIRVSSDPTAQIVRSDVHSTPGSDPANITIGPGAIIDGATPANSTVANSGSVILDSTNLLSLDPTATLSANTLTIDSGTISIELPALAEPITTAPSGLVISSASLATLQASAQNLSLLSYSTLDLYGSGDIGGPAAAGVFPVDNLAIHAAEIRGFDNGGATVAIHAQNVALGGTPDGTVAGSVQPASGTLAINANTIQLGADPLDIDQFSQVTLTAAKDMVLGNGTGGLSTSSNLTLATPLLTAAPVVALTPAQEQQGQVAALPTNQSISAGGALVVSNSGGSVPALTEGLGATLSLTGTSVNLASSVILPSGDLALHATDGDVTVSDGGTLNVSGSTQTIFDVPEYTNGGQVTLTSDNGNVNLAAGSLVDVAAPAAGGNAGTFSVGASQGAFTFAGSIFGNSGKGGQAGTFSLDVGSLPTLDSLDPVLNAEGFTQSCSIRVRTGDVALNDTATAQNFNLSTDSGSITINGEIDASGQTGGTIDLEASGSVSLANNSVLTVEGKTFNDAGQGGRVSLEAGSETNGSFDPTGYVNIGAGSTINLTVDDNTTASAAVGDLAGTLHIRAPAFADGSGLQVNPIQGTITGASSVTVEGYKIYTPANGSIDSVEGGPDTSTPDDGTVYGDAEGFAANTPTILSGLLSNTSNNNQASLFQLIPGAEIINNNLDTAANPTAGDLTLAANWDLSSFRFGPDNVPGALTMRAGGNIVFDSQASLSDGFTPDPSYGLWTATLMQGSSWSYRLVAGADFGAADYRRVLPKSELESRDSNNNPVLNPQGNVVYNGSVLLGYGTPALSAGTAATVIPSYFQTIRTGTGDISIYAGGDVQLLNTLDTIYTAGALDPNQSLDGTFDSPDSILAYPAQYSFEGGNVVVSAQNNIGHYHADGSLDSSLELPTNWLYRQGAVGSNGLFADIHGTTSVESTSWWTDFSSFFQGVGALGGGNVSLTAGNDILNVDAVVPTNARMPGVDSAGNSIAPNAGSLVELGGGDLLVDAGDDISGGIYYVERGQGALNAGNEILANSAQAALPLSSTGAPDPQSFLPTTLFLGGSDGGTGSASFTVTAGQDLLLGPVANPFLLPQGIGNSALEKSFFSTYAPNDAVDASSLTGTVTLQDSSDLGKGSLAAYYQNVLNVAPTNGSSTIAGQDPFLGLIEPAASLIDFATVDELMAPTLQVIAFSGDIDTRGNLTLYPSSTGTLNLFAAGSLNGYQPNGLDTNDIENWGSSAFNLSDTNPDALPGIASPGAPPASTSFRSYSSASTTSSILGPINSAFLQTGATQGLALQLEQLLHAPGILHLNDPTGPVHLYAENGDISGINLYAGKASEIDAGQDITDIAFYLQNVSSNDVSLVEAGRDIVAYDVNSPLRLMAQTTGNAPIGYDSGVNLEGFGLGAPNAGDIQIAGLGALEVLAGRNLDLGSGPANANGTGVGISSIGGSVNPSLPFSGADIVAAAGLGGGVGLSDSNLTFTNSSGTGFTDLFLNPSSAESSRYLPDLGTLLNLPPGETDQQIWAAFNQKTVQQQDLLALDIFYLVLRDSGRDHNDPSSPNAGTYTEGYAAIASLFPTSNNTGSITLTSREIKTTNGGNIGLLAPNGAINVGIDVPGAQPVDQGILTVDGGNISIFAKGNVNVGTSRIFTLHGGNEILFSSTGNIDAGASSKTVQSAPPTRVLVYPTSGDVETDLAGLATGGGIGVLETVAGAAPGDVDLVAPRGIVDAGDAGIRASGNLNIAAVQVLNASNISVGGKSSGVPTGASAPNLGALAAANSTAGAAENAAADVTKQNDGQALADQSDAPSIISVEVIGYGGGDQD